MMINKAYNYLKENGVKSFFDRVKMHNKLLKNREYKIGYNGLYLLKQRYKKQIILKNKDIYFISNKNYSDDENISKIIKNLNSIGYAVHYYTSKKVKKYSFLLPLVENTKVNSKLINRIKNQYVFIDNIKIDIDKSNTFFNIKNINSLYNSNFNVSKYKNKISVIVLNYNNKKIIERCIQSLLKHNSYYYEIIVIDNCSTDGSYEMIKSKYNKKINILQNKKNGCASGRNLGINNAKGEYILFLDSDQFVLYDNWLDNYLEIMDNNVGAIGWTCGWFNKNGYEQQIADNYVFRNMPPFGFYRKDVNYLGTGGMFINKKKLEFVKGFDEKYDPTCYEDTDISLSIKNIGYELIYCPYLGIEHAAHQTTKSGSKEHEKLMNKNFNYFINKWHVINKNLLKSNR